MTMLLVFCFSIRAARAGSGVAVDYPSPHIGAIPIKGSVRSLSNESALASNKQCGAFGCQAKYETPQGRGTQRAPNKAPLIVRGFYLIDRAVALTLSSSKAIGRSAANVAMSTPQSVRSGTAAAMKRGRSLLHWITSGLNSSLHHPATIAFGRKLSTSAIKMWRHTNKTVQVCGRAFHSAARAATTSAMNAASGLIPAHRRRPRRGVRQHDPRAQREEIGRILAIDDDDLYAMLRLTEHSSIAQIKSSFRQIARLLHPDKCQAGCDMTKAHAAFLKLQAAHSTLSDESSRAAHNEERQLKKRMQDIGLHAHARTSRMTPNRARRTMGQMRGQREGRAGWQRFRY